MKLTWSWISSVVSFHPHCTFSGHALMDVTWAKENWVGEWRLLTLRILKQKISQWMHTNNVRFTHHRASPSRRVTVHSAKKKRVIQGNQWRSVKNVCLSQLWVLRVSDNNDVDQSFSGVECWVCVCFKPKNVCVSQNRLPRGGDTSVVH